MKKKAVREKVTDSSHEIDGMPSRGYDHVRLHLKESHCEIEQPYDHGEDTILTSRVGAVQMALLILDRYREEATEQLKWQQSLVRDLLPDRRPLIEFLGESARHHDSTANQVSRKKKKTTKKKPTKGQ
jgi:hypothetical protein